MYVPEDNVDDEAVDEDRGIEQIIRAVLPALRSPPALHRHYIQSRANDLSVIIIKMTMNTR